MKGTLENAIFSSVYRKMIADLKKLTRDDLREEEKLYDIRTSTGAGRKGSADRPISLSTRRLVRRDTGTKPRPADREAPTDRDAGATPAVDAEV